MIKNINSLINEGLLSSHFGLKSQRNLFLAFRKKRHILRGTYFGYPRYCIEFFIKNANCDNWFDFYYEKHLSTKNILNDGGFIPCEKHLLKIHKEIITSKSLIKNRICPEPFPREREIPFSNFYLNKLISSRTKKTNQ